MRILRRLALCALLMVSAANARVVHRRALLIGINDYTATQLGHIQPGVKVQDRDWPNLTGAVNDVTMLQDMLVLLYGFERDDIVVLTDQAATRSAILTAIERHLVEPAKKDDILFFYFAGHGSRVLNTLSEERDKMDESTVPADSRLGAPDIRDKELRHYFNRILDRGAHLTVILDNCYSGSGTRGLPTGSRSRGVQPDMRDAADGSREPKPEGRGALVISATQDTDPAWEMRDRDGNFHGAFSWAWIRALRAASSGEPALETFLRAQAFLRVETPYQDPVLAGTAETKLRPFLGTRDDRRDDRVVVAIEKVRPDGTIVLNGGCANGLTVGSELAVDGTEAHLKITAILGAGTSEARPEPPAATIRPGMLAEVVAWAAPPENPLRVWMPQAAEPMKAIAELARQLEDEAKSRGVEWVTNPIDGRVSCVLRYGNHGWELLRPGVDAEQLQSHDAALAAMSRIPAGSSLFVQFPAPAALIDAIKAEQCGIVRTDRPDEADYILTGRRSSQRLSYAFLRPAVKRSDRRNTGLPLQTEWAWEPRYDARLARITPRLRTALKHLHRIDAWQQLESPPAGRFPYQLGFRRTRDGLAVGNRLMSDETYTALLRVRTLPFPDPLKPRFVYVFVIDSDGKSTLLFPGSDQGSVENRFPTSTPPPNEIELDDTRFRPGRPYGVDTFFLLTTGVPLPDPSILEWDGVRALAREPQTPLEQFLKLVASGTRGTPFLTPSAWSIERLPVESIRSRTTKSDS